MKNLNSPKTQPLFSQNTTLYIPGRGIVNVFSEIQNLDNRILEVRNENAIQDERIKILRTILEE